MKLSEKQILSAAVGAVRYVKDARGIGLRRFTEKQEAVFTERKELFPEPYFNEAFGSYFGSNCLTGAGIGLDFVTDADAVEIVRGGYDRINDAKEILTSDLLVDGRLVRSFEEDAVRVSFREKKLRRFRLYLPYFRSDYISGVELAGAGVFRPSFGTETDILLLGDSITHGVGALHPSRTMATVLGRRLGAKILNQGNSGYVYDPDTLEKVCGPKLIVMAYGHNDRGRKTPERLFADTAAYAKRVRELWGSTPAVGILPLWCAAEADPGMEKHFRMLDGLFREAYESNGVTVIDGAELIPHDPRYFRDAAHPNDRGYLIYGGRLAKKLTAAGLYGK